MTTNQPDRIDRLEARVNNLLVITERLVQTAEIHQQNIDQLAQLQVNSLQRIEDMLERFLRQSGNGRQGA